MIVLSFKILSIAMKTISTHLSKRKNTPIILCLILQMQEHMSTRQKSISARLPSEHMNLSAILSLTICLMMGTCLIWLKVGMITIWSHIWTLIHGMTFSDLQTVSIGSVVMGRLTKQTKGCIMLNLPLKKAKTTVTTILRYDKSKVLEWIEFSLYEFESLDDVRRFCLYNQCLTLSGELQIGTPIIESFKCFTIKESELYGCLFKWVVIQ